MLSRYWVPHHQPVSSSWFSSIASCLLWPSLIAVSVSGACNPNIIGIDDVFVPWDISLSRVTNSVFLRAIDHWQTKLQWYGPVPDTHDLWILNTQTQSWAGKFCIIFLTRSTVLREVQLFSVIAPDHHFSVWSPWPPSVSGSIVSLCNGTWSALLAPPRCNLAIVTFIIIIPEYQYLGCTL